MIGRVVILEAITTRRPPPKSKRLFGVLELRARLQSFLRRARQHQLVINQLELGDRNGDVVLCHGEEAAGIDDRVGNRLAACNNNVVDRSDALIADIVDRSS